MVAKRRMGTYCQYVSAMFSTAISLADLPSGQRQLFWGPMWICVSVCEYLVIWCDKTTFHELNDSTTYIYYMYFHFTVSHALGSQPSLAISLKWTYQSHCNFNSHMKSSWHRLNPFLPFLLNRLGLPSPELDPVLLWLLFCTPSTLLLLPLSCWTLLITTLTDPMESTVFTSPSCTFTSAGTCLLTHCVAMGIDVTIWTSTNKEHN
jgi:hypothetical protein